MLTRPTWESALVPRQTVDPTIGPRAILVDDTVGTAWCWHPHEPAAGHERPQLTPFGAFEQRLNDHWPAIRSQVNIHREVATGHDSVLVVVRGHH